MLLPEGWRTVLTMAALDGTAALATISVGAWGDALWYPSRLPWLLPALALTLATAALAGDRVARWLGVSRATAWAALLSTGVILSGTLTPLDGQYRYAPHLPGTCDMSRMGPAGLGALAEPGDVLFNVLMFVPLGLALGLAPLSRRTAAVIATALGLPFMIEATQLVVVPLRRGCQSADVADNVTGLLVGLLATFVAVGLVRLTRRLSRAAKP